jgi:Ca2+-binding EF-hand superfamily protein
LQDESISASATARLERLFKMFDKNGDGRLDDQERAAMLQFVKNFEDRR